MFRKVLNKLPRKSSKGSDQGGTGRSHGPSKNNNNNNNSNTEIAVPGGTSKPGNSSAAALTAGGQNHHGNRAPLPNSVDENPNNGNFNFNFNSSSNSYEALPPFRDAPNSEKPTLFIKKLKMCSVV